MLVFVRFIVFSQTGTGRGFALPNSLFSFVQHLGTIDVLGYGEGMVGLSETQINIP